MLQQFCGLHAQVNKYSYAEINRVESWEQPSWSRAQLNFRLSMVHGSERLGKIIWFSIRECSAKTTIRFELKTHYLHMTNGFELHLQMLFFIPKMETFIELLLRAASFRHSRILWGGKKDWFK